MEHTLALKARFGVEVAAGYLSEHGINRELAIFVLVGSKGAPRYGASPSEHWQRRGKT